jgi:hypothetical protein
MVLFLSSVWKNLRCIVKFRNGSNARQRNQHPSATDIFNRIVRVNALDKWDAVINHRTRILKDDVTVGKRIGRLKCYQDKVFPKQFGFHRNRLELAPDSAAPQHFSSSLASPSQTRPFNGTRPVCPSVSEPKPLQRFNFSTNHEPRCKPARQSWPRKS